MEPISGMREAAGPLFVQEWPGPSEGSTFVLLHGLGGSHLNWMRLAPLLATRGPVLVPDMPGCGLTPRAGRQTGLASAQRSVRALLRQLGRPAILLGNSMGGATAVVVAATDPAACAGLVLCGPALPPAADPSGFARALAVAMGLPLASDLAGHARVRVLTPERYVAIGFRIVLADPQSQPATVIAAHTDMMRRTQADPEAARSFAQATRSVLGFLTRPTSRRYLEAVSCPVLVLQGGKDRVVPSDVVTQAVPPSWELQRWPDLGHLVQLEDPARTMAAIDGWLARQGPDQGSGSTVDSPSGRASAAPMAPIKIIAPPRSVPAPTDSDSSS